MSDVAVSGADDDSSKKASPSCCWATPFAPRRKVYTGNVDDDDQLTLPTVIIYSCSCRCNNCGVGKHLFNGNEPYLNRRICKCVQCNNRS